jgi:hypothetical protein
MVKKKTDVEIVTAHSQKALKHGIWMFSSCDYIDGHRPTVYAYIGLAYIGYIYIGMCGAIGIWLDRVNR